MEIVKIYSLFCTITICVHSLTRLR